MSKYRKGIVASGHELVSEAAGAVLREGGNAFDAVVAAGFASTVVEQTLTSLGGGGFLLGHSSASGQNVFFDFFVNTPGLDAKNNVEKPHFFPITVQFAGAPQDFNVGLGSVAVPGIAKGLLHIHNRLGRMDLKDIISPAVEYAKGHRVNKFQGQFLKLLTPIMEQSSTGRMLYASEKYIETGDVLVNTSLAGFIQQLAEDGGDSFYRGDIAAEIAADMENQGGLLTIKDLASYEVIERRPLKVSYGDASFYTSPPPSMGGTLIALSLSLYSACETGHLEWGGKDHLQQTLMIMKEVERLRKSGITEPEKLKTFLQGDIDHSLENIRMFSRGTTHISIADKYGNCASMTCSNGEGSGYFAPGTGVMLNNMMGEDDLHPEGFHSSPPGQRVGSMMSPSLLVRGGNVELVIGSGGSKRIRTAISQVLNQVVDFNRELQQAVSAPRLYLDEGCLQVEPGFDPAVLHQLGVELNIWDVKDVYFGGVHAVIPGKEGAGDPRRGGSVLTVES